MRKTIATLLVAGVAFAAVSADASARTRRRAPVPVAEQAVGLDASIPLTVNRRSWLDPGNAVRTTGTGPSYVSANTVLNKTQDQIFAPDTFGNDVIKGQPYVPGRSHPVAEGSILPNGQVVVDTALLPQNFYLNPAPSVAAAAPAPVPLLPQDPLAP